MSIRINEPWFYLPPSIKQDNDKYCLTISKGESVEGDFCAVEYLDPYELKGNQDLWLNGERIQVVSSTLYGALYNMLHLLEKHGYRYKHTMKYEWLNDV